MNIIIEDYWHLLFKAECFIEVFATDKNGNLTCEIIHGNLTCAKLSLLMIVVKLVNIYNIL